MPENIIYLLWFIAGRGHEEARWALTSTMLYCFLNIANNFESNHSTHRLLFLALVWS